MWSKNKKKMTPLERSHVDLVKSVPCSVCDAPPPSDAHEPVQGLWFCAISLCRECHQGAQGWHGDKTLWRIFKRDEWEALNITLKRVGELRNGQHDS